MNVQERQANLLNEAKALKFFFSLSSPKLVAAFDKFNELYTSNEAVTPEEFEQSLNNIDSEIEDLCIAHKVTQESLEALMHKNDSFHSVIIS